MKPIDRSSVNQQQYAAPEFPKSGFDLTHRRWSSYLIGRLHISGYQDVMPGDKISGSNEGEFYFNRMTTPLVAPVEVAQYNMFIPYRALDTSFMEAFAPSKNNGMSASWSAPSFSLKEAVERIIKSIAGGSAASESTSFINALVVAQSYLILQNDPDSTTIQDLLDDEFNSDTVANVIYGTYDGGTKIGLVKGILDAFDGTEPYLKTQLQKVYFDDSLKDYYEYAVSKLGTLDSPAVTTTTLLSSFLYNVYDVIFSPVIGRYSYLKELGYNYIRPKDLYYLTHDFDNLSAPTDFTTFTELFDGTLQNEYAIRAMYAIWYEHFRNVDLEPVSTDLPKWRQFGSTSISAGKFPYPYIYFAYRFRNWYKDMFTTAQIDDLSRHVFAPVYASSDSLASGHVADYNNFYTNTNNDPTNVFDGGSKASLYTLSWYDQLNETVQSLSCPVPANINDILSASDLTSVDIYGLDLNSLRQAQMLEKYLKRNYLFGDEYQDRMLGHYNSRVSDLRINRPEIIGRSLNSSDQKQEIANMSNGISNAGDRTVIASINASGDMFTTYCEEFGIVINLINFMPFSIYDGTCNQRLLSKVNDYPLPEFAANNEEFGRRREIADAAIVIDQDPASHGPNYMFGRYPAYHAWRGRTDEVGGMFLDELQDCTFRRFWGLYNAESTPKLNYEFLHCRPNLQMFADTVRYSSQIYGHVLHNCFVERVLPTPVEVI